MSSKPEVIGEKDKEQPIKRPDGWPELAVPVRNVATATDAKGMAILPVVRLIKRNDKL